MLRSRKFLTEQGNTIDCQGNKKERLMRSFLFVFALQGREQNHIANAGAVG
jgi:hypothetical protein